MLSSNKQKCLQAMPGKSFDFAKIKGPAKDIFEKSAGLKYSYDSASHLGVLFKNNKKTAEIQYLYRFDIPSPSEFPSYYKYSKGHDDYCKAHVCIRDLTVYDRNKGYGTFLMKEAVKHSLKDQIDGRVFVNAICTDGVTSPCMFYYKLGFRCITPEKNMAIKRAIKDNAILPKDFEDFMFLPRENVVQLLSK